MSNLYTNLSAVYEAMYQSFIDYEAEYKFYSNILLKYNCKSLVEIGCGSGNLSIPFKNAGFDYVGIDSSDEMLNLAKIKNPAALFLKEDMRKFELTAKKAAAIITGRTISYMLTDNDVMGTLQTIHKNLNTNGIICFDCIDANKFIPQIDEAKKIIHKARFKNNDYQRDSLWKINPAQRFSFDWASVYYEVNTNGSLLKIGEDHSTIRAFTKDDMALFLKLTGFTIVEIMERPSYAFDTFVIVAKKIN
jgi:SAM-dependent methyltransferase